MTQTIPPATYASAKPVTLPRRGRFHTISAETPGVAAACDPRALSSWERIDLIYRSLCGILYNFVPTSGHPGGSISSGRIVQALIYQNMVYDFAAPDRPDNDILSYAAGHKAMGLYANWALRNELV
ncbi:MAG: hypothetical protein HZB43_11590, partial [candidate division Zixibacteria bacterium]|nr:hypothetical protein [candidate division Zixibacteria bacterium]